MAPGAGLAPTHAASKAAELRLFNPGTKNGGSPGTCALPNRLKAGCPNYPSSRSENWGLQPVTLRQRFATREARSLLHEGVVGRHGFAPCSHRLRAGTSLSKFATCGVLSGSRTLRVGFADRSVRSLGHRTKQIGTASGYRDSWKSMRKY